MKIPNIYVQRLKKIKKDYQHKINTAKRGNGADYYLEKMNTLQSEMQQISDNEEISVRSRGEKIVELLKMFEEYAQKYEKDAQFTAQLEEEFKLEIRKIKDMIQQSNSSASSDDIDKSMAEYIITNTD